MRISRRIHRLLFGGWLIVLAPAQGYAGPFALDFTGSDGHRFLADLTFGWSFTVNETIRVDGLGFFDSFEDDVGLDQDHRVRIWTDDADQTLLADTIVTNASTEVASTAEGGLWLFEQIGLVTLTPGSYVIGADDLACSGPDCDFIGFFASATTISQITFVEARDSVVEGEVAEVGFPGFAVSQRNDGYFGPTFSIAVPEPTGISLLAAGLVALGWLSLRAEPRTGAQP